MSLAAANTALTSNQPEHFALLPDRADYRPVAHVTLAQSISMVTRAITCARAHKKSKMLVVTNGFTGFPPPTVADRYFFAREWATAANGELRIAFVARPEMIDEQKFGMLVAANSGLVADVFTAEPDALAWLQSVA